MRISDWSSDVCSSDLGSGEDGDAAAKDEDEKAASADEQDGDEPTFVVDTQTPVVAAGEPLVVEIPAGAPVEYVQTESGRVAMAYFSGFMARLDNVRNALRAWRSEERRVGKEDVSTRRYRWSHLT